MKEILNAFWILRKTTFLVTILVFAAIASATDVERPTATGTQYAMHTLRLDSEEMVEDPCDQSINVAWKDDNGVKTTVPGFWNGEQTYLSRFTPTTAGTWDYQVESSIPSLNGRRGQLQVAAADANLRGGVIVSPENSRQFSFQNGAPYFPIAFECDWLFALDADNSQDIPKTRQLIKTLSKNGFNQVVMNVYAHDVQWGKDERLLPQHEYGSPKAFPFLGTNESPRHEELNIAYFQNLDRVIECLQANGIIAHLMIYVWNKRVNWPEANSEADNRYFDYVVKRYQAYPNLVWDISKEALGYGHDDVNYISERIDRLRGLDAHRRLVTVHDYSYCRRFPEALDFVSVQLWSSELYGVMRNTVERFPNKPILNIEHGGYERGPYRVFEGEYTSPEVCLERAYQCVFAGTFPTHYWQGAAWNVVIHDLQALPPDDRPRLHFYRHLSNLVERYQIGALTAGKKHSNSGFCMTDNQRTFLYYVPKENEHINLRLPKELRGRTMRSIWFDPFTGNYSQPIKRKVVQWPAFEKPASTQFAILIVQIDDA